MDSVPKRIFTMQTDMQTFNLLRLLAEDQSRSMAGMVRFLVRREARKLRTAQHQDGPHNAEVEHGQPLPER